MFLLHSIFALFHTVPGKILFVGTIATDAVLSFFAVAEPASNRTLIILAICGNITVLIGVVFTGLITLKSARISASNAKTLEPLAALPNKITELSKGIDGVAHELKAATAEARFLHERHGSEICGSLAHQIRYGRLKTRRSLQPDHFRHRDFCPSRKRK